MSKIVGQEVKEITKIRNSIDRFQYVEVLETIMKDLRKGLIDAQTVLYHERLKLAKKQKLSEAKDKKTKVPRPESPLSPMVYGDIYDPLTKKSQAKTHSKKGLKSYVTVEDKLNNLDLLEQDVSPTPVQYGPQDSAPQSRHHRQPGDLISNSLFDGDDLVEPTPVGGSSRGF